MITQKRKFLYQPNLYSSIIDWSWTVAFLLIGIILWLEVTHFNTSTLIFMLIFIILSWYQIYCRKIIVDNDFLIFKSALNPIGKKMKISEISNVNINNNIIMFTFKNKKYEVMMPQNSILQLKSLI
ncbi:pore-forming protein [Lactobacillus sp. S2-2]|uniref:EbsA family protein n=1 Tax=Lactobacillus sp. S2-2 TaxID=2692917 RepID=UPI001F209C11|nr:EbsA family protein [Lactobacillus sp. S2-2]MCF6515062.1 pore-forming protein [Lactobacillus sp. S2-2]